MLAFGTGYGQYGNLRAGGQVWGWPCGCAGGNCYPGCGYGCYPVWAPSAGTTIFIPSHTGASQLLVANANRKAAVIYNTSLLDLYVLLSGTEALSTSLFTTIVSGLTRYDVPGGYNGFISGMWLSTDAGGAMVTELT